MKNTDQTPRIRVWDIPTRVFHWSIVGLVFTSWWSAENGAMEWHSRSGYALLTLLLFRILWGIVGSDTSRFSTFIRSPAVVWDYCKTLRLRQPSKILGHNPLGGWSVLLLLGLLLTQIGLGLFAVDVDGMESGPLSHLVSFKEGRLLAGLHEDLFDVLLLVIFLHIAAVFFYVFYKRSNILLAMFTGTKKTDQEAGFYFAPLWLAAASLMVAGAAVWWLVT